MAITPALREKATKAYLNPMWRVNHLYTIQTKRDGLKPFRPNWAQQQIFTTAKQFGKQTKRNVPLKGRQLGISTGIRVNHFDRAITAAKGHPFNSALVDISLEKAKEKMAWIRLMWENLDNPAILGELPALIGADIKRTNPLVVDRACHMEWYNGSSMRAGTSFQGSTVSALHVSEYGEISHDYPDRSDGILYKTLPAVPKDCDIWLEGTHQGGKGGNFYNLCQKGISNLGRPLSALNELDWIFHFLPWHRHPEYTIDGSLDELSDNTRDYAAELSGKHGTILTPQQMLWWQGQFADLKNQIYLQYPSTVEEAFNAPSAKSVYGDLMLAVRASNRVKSYEHAPGAPVYTSWDLGQSDSTAIWWFQVYGQEILVLDWYEAEGKPASHYAGIIREKEQMFGQTSYHLLPHDADHKTKGDGRNYRDYLRECGLANTVTVPKIGRRQMGIDMVRDILPRCLFHSRCDLPRVHNGETRMSGVQCIEAYHYKEERVGEVISREPVHDSSSHSSDAFRTFGEGLTQKVVPGLSVFGGGMPVVDIPRAESRSAQRRRERQEAGSGMSITGMSKIA